VLGNDYHNLSLIRNLRYMEDEGSVKTMPYLSHVVDVFDSEGSPLYVQREPRPLSMADRRQLEEKPWFWEVEGRDTVFYFRGGELIYRITHKATPLKMIGVRYLALYLVIYLLVRSIHFFQRPGRGLLARWNRSFSIKMAGFVFLSSVIPTALVGSYLLTSIRNSQDRAQRDMARTQILAVRNLLRNLVEDDRGGGTSPRELRLQKFARLLGEDLSLYINGSLVKTSQPEVFRRGMMNRRLGYDLARRLYLDRAAYHYERGSHGPDITYAPFVLGPDRQAVLAMTMIPFSQNQRIRWLEQIELSVALLLGLMFLMGLLARVLAGYFLEPVSAITRRASRVARGQGYRRINLERQDELQRMVDAFNTMQEQIQASRRRLEQQLQLLDETLKSMSGGLLGFDNEGQTILQNARALELLGLDESPESLAALVARREEAAPLTSAFARREEAEVSWLQDQDTQREILARLLVVPSSRAGDLYAILALEDITDALEASRFKAWSEMARRVAHEIKNPLTPIRLELDHLLRLYQDQHPDFPTALEEAVNEIGDQVRHLQKIATEFGDYARPVVLEPAPTDLPSLLERILEPYRKTLEGLRIETFYDSEEPAFVDERLLRRAIANLVVNAIQAMDSEGTLRLKCYETENAHEIWIEDTGPGIPRDEHHQVFEAYFSTKDQGTGLGLVIARRYITLHGGSLRISTDYEEGTRFIIHLPREEDASSRGRIGGEEEP